MWRTTKQWQVEQKRMSNLFREFLDDKSKRSSQEEFLYFYTMIKLAFDNKTIDEVDCHGFTKFQMSFLVKDIFFWLAERVESEEIIYHFVVGQGRHSQGTPQLRERIQEICQKDFNVKGTFLTHNAGNYQIKVTPESAKWIKVIRDITKNLDLFLNFKGQKQKDLRVFNGFSSNEFQHIVLKYWDLGLVNEKLKEKVWGNIINLTSKKFPLLLKELDPTEDNKNLLEKLNEFYQKKPQLLSELLPLRNTEKGRNMIIYTFTKATKELNFSSFYNQEDTIECLSPSKEKVEGLLELNKNLFLRFDEYSKEDHNDEIWIDKKLKAIKRILDTSKGPLKSIALIIHLKDDSTSDSNFLPFDSNWEQFMIDSLFNQ